MIDKNQRAQHYVTGYATTCYMKCTDDVILFAGPQRIRTVAASAKDGSFKPGIQVLGLAENGVGWALDEHNAGLVNADMNAAVAKAEKGILDGSIKVHDYMSDSNCPG